MKKKTIYILTETFEGVDGLRDFQTLGASYKIKKLRKLMKAKIKEDEYKYIKNNGVEFSNEDYFITNWNDGLIEYSIMKDKII